MPRSTRFSKRRALVLQALVLIGIILAWEFIPQIPGLREISIFFDPGFVSSPSEILGTLVRIGTGRDVAPIGPYVQETLQNALIGTTIGVTLGIVAGLVLSNDE